MDVREATSADAEGIRRVASASLEATYADALGEDVVAEAVDEWYRNGRLADRLDDESVQFLVAADDGDVVAFSESELDGDAAAAIEWLHVHPDHRERGLGVELLERTEAELLERGANRIEGRVIAANQSGNEFYQDHGYVRTGARTLSVAGSDHTENLYVKLPESEDPTLIEPRETAEGTLYVAFDERERGSKAPFYSAYRTEDRNDRFGFYCANCESVDTSMDSMGRVECANCGNKRRATRWDSAYL
ncbi:GNAT family N-acetyltransferase [Halobacterium litoreum]|uniref:GNAT family N-acetyltransferase n=1 Tax=Halobacterium litoreum TaxID=2039234 RepID=A0ABD5NHJ8_9EURY|nr:GNAT family N-acetyltransferase [Halobacterium litoreum]UHH12360.1 GNAT family N-acetyltransferase [Halobacterium litoreum]